MKKIKVGFVFLSDLWGGGENYYINLFSAIKQNQAVNLEVIVFVSSKCSSAFINRIKNVANVVEFKQSERIFKLFRKLSDNYMMRSLCKKYEVNVLSHYAGLKLFINIPVVAWIPDFQHIRMPHFFSKKELVLRNIWYYVYSLQSKKVILSSYDAYNDFSQKYPSLKSKGCVLNFVVQIGDYIFNEKKWDDYKSKHSITEPFFYVPNQFWIHKNHQILLRALSLLKQEGYNCNILLTGKTEDYRHPEYFLDLMNDVVANNLDSNFKVLGEVEYELVNYLMQKSLAVINPSFFEGWSTTVEEAKAINKKVILSNIPVHIEQNPAQGYYFDPLNPNSLCEIIKRIFLEAENLRQETYTEEHKNRILNFSKQYEKIILEVI